MFVLLGLAPAVISFAGCLNEVKPLMINHWKLTNLTKTIKDFPKSNKTRGRNDNFSSNRHSSHSSYDLFFAQQGLIWQSIALQNCITSYKLYGPYNMAYKLYDIIWYIIILQLSYHERRLRVLYIIVRSSNKQNLNCKNASQ